MCDLCIPADFIISTARPLFTVQGPVSYIQYAFFAPHTAKTLEIIVASVYHFQHKHVIRTGKPARLFRRFLSTRNAMEKNGKPLS